MKTRVLYYMICCLFCPLMLLAWQADNSNLELEVKTASGEEVNLEAEPGSNPGSNEPNRSSSVEETATPVSNEATGNYQLPSGKIDLVREGYNLRIKGGQAPFTLNFINRQSNKMSHTLETAEHQVKLAKSIAEEIGGGSFDVWVIDARSNRVLLEGMIGLDPTVATQEVRDDFPYVTLGILSVLVLGLVVFFVIFNNRKEQRTKTMFER